MFPRMRQRLGSALRENLDVLVEFSTLGEFRLMDDERVLPAPLVSELLEPAARPPLPTGHMHCVPSRVRAATPAARAHARTRAGAPEPRPQLCTADAA